MPDAENMEVDVVIEEATSTAKEREISIATKVEDLREENLKDKERKMPAPTAVLSQKDVQMDTNSEDGISVQSLTSYDKPHREHNTHRDGRRLRNAHRRRIPTSFRPFYTHCTSLHMLTQTSSKPQIRRITIPPHRLTPLRNNWSKIYPPLVEHLELQVRMNTKTKQVEMRTSKFTTDGGGALQKGADFLRAFTLGFDVDVPTNTKLN
jgi:RNA-binding protein PNO1